MESKWNLKKGLGVKLAVAALVVLTLFRFYLGIKTPVLLQANAGYDDFLYVRYASSMLEGEWLGDFSVFTLLKAASPALLLAVSYALGISYAVSVTVGYIVAVFLFALAMHRLVKNRVFAAALYVFLLYSPNMFHEENVQKVYRGGYIVIFTLLVFAAVIGMYAARRSRRKREFGGWVLLGCVSLPVFYYLKEDSIWIMPFVCMGTLITVIDIWKSRRTFRQLKIVVAVLPLFALWLAGVGYKSLNYFYYGEYTVTDRSGTYCKEVLSDLLKVDDGIEEADLAVWVSRDMVRTAAQHSETLGELLPYLEKSWRQWFGDDRNPPGDFYIWAFRDAVQMAGVYEKGGVYVNDYYRKLHTELQEAYDSGRLSARQGRIYISPVTRGFTLGELAEYYRRRFPDVVKILVAYKQNITTSKESTGTDENLAAMSALTGSPFRRSGTENLYYRYDEKIAAADNKITGVYQKTGYAVFFVAFAGMAVFTLSLLSRLEKKKATEQEVSVLLVTLGMAASCLLVMVAVTWFCNFLSDRKIYDYLCAAVPLMEAVEAVGIYCLAVYARAGVRKIRAGRG